MPSTRTTRNGSDERELDDALTARAGAHHPAYEWCGSHGQLNAASFFIDDSTCILSVPPVKKGRISGVMNVHV